MAVTESDRIADPLGAILDLAASGDRRELARALTWACRHAGLAPGQWQRVARSLRRNGHERLVRLLGARLRRAGATHPNWRQAAMAMWAAGRFGDLLGWLEQHPARPAVRALLAGLAADSAARGDGAAAIALYEGMTGWAPDDVHGLLALASLHVGAGHGAAALAAAERARRLAPHLAEADALLRRAAGLELARIVADPAGTDCRRDAAAVALIGEVLPGDSRLSDARAALTLARVAAGAGADGEAGPPITTGSIVEAIRRLAPAADASLRPRLRLAFAVLLAGHGDRAAAPDMIDTLVRIAPFLVLALAGTLADAGDAREAMNRLRGIDEPALTPSEWLDAAKLAAAAGSADDLLDLSRRAARGGITAVTAEASRLLRERECQAASAAIWALHDAGDSFRGRVEATLAIRASGGAAAFWSAAAETLRSAPPLAEMPVADQARHVSLVRAMFATARKARIGIDDLPAEGEENSAIACWTAAMLRAAAQDFGSALDRLDAATAMPAPAAGTGLDIRAEIAALNAHLYRFGAARRALAEVDPAVAARPHYERAFRLLRDVTQFCGEAEYYPECLVDVLIGETVADPLRYSPEPGHLMTILPSLAMGGAERQSVTIIRGLAGDARVSRQTILVRSLAGGRDFFLPDLKNLPLDLAAFGDDPEPTPDIDQALPELRPRLRQAIDLMPRDMREHVIRIVRLILDRRPGAVHIQQDMYLAALACAIAGVPTYFIYRSSLARHTWDTSPLQADRMLRPLRHIYRTLLARTPFFIANNSRAGCESDRAWLEVDDPGRLHLVHNLHEFAPLRKTAAAAADLRAELGIPGSAPVIGTVFRFAPVKRPLLWIAIAEAVLAVEPAAHFVMVGDGPLQGAVRDFAAARGFAGRLHMPGAVHDVDRWYGIMDLFLLTSEREGLPNVTIECQHCGVPVVAADVGGIAETLLVGVTGLLVPRDAAPRQFADRIVMALRDTAWRGEASRQAPDHVHAKFGVARGVDTLLGLCGFR